MKAADVKNCIKAVRETKSGLFDLIGDLHELMVAAGDPAFDQRALDEMREHMEINIGLMADSLRDAASGLSGEGGVK